MPEDSLYNLLYAAKLEKYPDFKRKKKQMVQVLVKPHGINSKLSALGPEATLIYQILKNEPMTPDNLVTCLMSEPYKVKHVRIINGLLLLLYAGLIRILTFQPSKTENFKVEVCLTVNHET